MSDTDRVDSGSLETSKKAKTRAGELNGNSKLTEAEVIEILARLAIGDSLREIASDYSVGKSQIHNIATGKQWGHLE